MGDFLIKLHAMFEELQRTIDDEIARGSTRATSPIDARPRGDVDLSHDRRAVRHHDRARDAPAWSRWCGGRWRMKPPRNPHP